MLILLMENSDPANYSPIKVDPVPEQLSPTEQKLIDKLFPKVKPEVRPLILPGTLLVVISILAIGLVLIANKPRKVSQQPTSVPIPTAEPTPSPISTTDWQTYSNFGIEIKTPPTWSDPETRLGATFTSLKFKSTFAIDIKGERFDENSFNDYIENYSQAVKTRPEDVIMGNKPSKKFDVVTGVDTDRIEIFTYSETPPLLVKISYDNLWNPEITNINQILSTFRFTK